MRDYKKINHRMHRPGWADRSIGSRFQYAVFHRLIRIGGRRSAYLLLHVVVCFYMLFRPAVRRRSDHYLLKRFPANNLSRRFLSAYRLSLELGKVLVDKAVVGILGPDRMAVTFPKQDRLLSLLSEEKGIILLNAHVGCWQVALSALHFIDRPVRMLIEQDADDVARHYYEHTDAPRPFEIIDPRGYLGGSLEMMNVLKKKEILCIMGDRVFGSLNNAVHVDFLGHRAPFPYSAFKIASATGAPIGVLFSHKTGPSSYELDLAAVIRVPGHLGRSKELFRPFVAQFVESLERFTQNHPYQFFNFYDMWDKMMI